MNRENQMIIHDNPLSIGVFFPTKKTSDYLIKVADMILIYIYNIIIYIIYNIMLYIYYIIYIL